MGMFGIAQMRVQFRFQTAFNHGFGQFYEVGGHRGAVIPLDLPEILLVVS
jgi:hypothetical protein